MIRSGRAIVTGAGGFIGKRIIHHFLMSGVDAIGWTRETADLRDPESVKGQISSLKPDLIVHLAAQPVGSGDEPWHLIADEQTMLTNLISAMPAHSQLIYTGSMAEYGRSGVFDELDMCRPDTAYGCAKHSCTTLALSMRLTHCLDIRVARLFGVFGPGESDRRLLPQVIAHLESGKAVKLSDGLQVRDFIHVDDVCQTLLSLSAEPELTPPIVNVGTGTGVTIRHVCELTANIMGADPSLLKFGAIARRSVDQDLLVAKTERLAKITSPPPQRWLSRTLAAECVAELLDRP